MLGYNISTYSQEEPYNKVADELQGMENAKQQLERALDILDEALSDFDRVAYTNYYEDYYEGKMSIMDILEDMQASIEDKENEL